MWATSLYVVYYSAYIPKKEKKESLETKANVLLNNSLFDAGCDSFKTK